MDIPALPQTFDSVQGGRVAFGDDSKLFVQFYQRPYLDKAQSQSLGRPHYVSVDFVRIQQPGERDVFDQPATDEHRGRFPKQWEAYRAGKADQIEGTLLAVLFPGNPDIVENLRYFKVFTVEQLAKLNDTQKQNIGMGAQQFVDAAQTFMEQSDKGKDFHGLSDQVERLTNQLAALAARNEALEAERAAKTERAPAPAATRKRGPYKPRATAAA